MISQKIEKMLNEQMNFENESAHIYLSIASFCKSQNLNGAESWFIAQYKEEKQHGMKIYDYLHEQGADVEICGFELPKVTYKDLLHVLEISLAHEQEVTKRITKLMEIAKAENDYATEAFLQWFILEQVEEEDTISELIARFNMYPQPAHLLLFDKEMGLRI